MVFMVKLYFIFTRYYNYNFGIKTNVLLFTETTIYRLQILNVNKKKLFESYIKIILQVFVKILKFKIVQN